MEVRTRRGSGGYRDGRTDGISCRGRHDSSPRIVDRANPVPYFLRCLCLEIKRSCRRDETERVRVLLQHDGCARMDVREVKQTEKLVLGVGFVERQVRRAQHKPPLLPRLLDDHGDKGETKMCGVGK